MAYFNRKYISFLASNLCFWEVLSSNLCILRLQLNVCFTKTTRGRQRSNFASLQSLVIVYQFNSGLSFWAPFSRSSGATGWPSWLRWLVSASDPLVPGWAWNTISSVSLVVTFLVHEDKYRRVPAGWKSPVCQTKTLTQLVSLDQTLRRAVIIFVDIF